LSLSGRLAASRYAGAWYISVMLNNRRRVSEAQYRWARLRATVSMVFLNPLAVVIPGFLVVGIAMIAARELAPRHWPGACYEAHLESRGARPGQIPVCVKHTPFSNGQPFPHST